MTGVGKITTNFTETDMDPRSVRAKLHKVKEIGINLQSSSKSYHLTAYYMKMLLISSNIYIVPHSGVISSRSKLYIYIKQHFLQTSDMKAKLQILQVLVDAFNKLNLYSIKHKYNLSHIHIEGLTKSFNEHCLRKTSCFTCQISSYYNTAVKADSNYPNI